MRPHSHRLYNFAVLVVFFAVLAFGWAKAEAIQDWFKLRNYNPPASVQNLAKKDALTSLAEHLFYINHPQVTSDASAFRQSCSEAEQTIVLGCYHPGESGIDVYNVSDSRLSGVVEVTAAHETLHAAYERLSSKDRRQVDSWLEDYYQHDLHDQRILDTINAYKKTEPNNLLDEMHSVFGTEVANLPQSLEQYYQRYFTNRSVVSSFAANYEGVFTNLENQLKDDQRELNVLSSQINTEKSLLNSQYNQINSDRARLDQERASGEIAAYNAGVASYNAEVDKYNLSVARVRDYIDKYNTLVSAYNSLGAELASLENAIDTRTAPQTLTR